MFSGHRPFKNLTAEDITSANVRLSPPDTTIQISETEELASYLNEVVIYNKDNSYTEYAGQAVIFTLSLADGSQVEIIAYNPFIIIDGIGYKCKYEPCEALNHYATEPDDMWSQAYEANPHVFELDNGGLMVSFTFSETVDTILPVAPETLYEIEGETISLPGILPRMKSWCMERH